MLQSKLIRLLKTLSKEEWTALNAFIHSPFHNKHLKVRKLFLYLYDLKTFNTNNLNETHICSILFEKSNPNSKKQFNHVKSYLFKAVEAFLIYQEGQNDQKKIDKITLQMYRKRGMEKMFRSTLQKINKKQTQGSYRNSAFFEHQFKIELETYAWQEHQTKRGEMDLQALSDTLDTAFIIEKLKHSCTLLSHQAVYKTAYETGLLDAVLAYIVQNNLLKTPAIAIYYHSYHALKNPENLIHFQTLKSLIKKFAALFPPEELKSIYVLTINFCIRQINLGNPVFFKESFDLYKEGLSNKALLDNGRLSRWTYKNIVASGLVLQEFEWIEYFIHHYKDYVTEIYQESVYQYNLAQLHYYRKEHGKAMELLLRVNEKDLLLLLSAKTLLCKIYYELNEIKTLDSFLHSFELYVRRQSAIGYHQKNYLHFTKCMKRLIKVNFHDKKAVNDFKEMIVAYKILPEKKWLLLQL